jgi:hypothetical protein
MFLLSRSFGKPGFILFLIPTSDSRLASTLQHLKKGRDLRGGIISFSNINKTFSNAVGPATASPWPTFALTEPICSGCFELRRLLRGAKTSVTDTISCASPACVLSNKLVYQTCVFNQEGGGGEQEPGDERREIYPLIGRTNCNVCGFYLAL